MAGKASSLPLPPFFDTSNEANFGGSYVGGAGAGWYPWYDEGPSAYFDLLFLFGPGQQLLKQEKHPQQHSSPQHKHRTQQKTMDKTINDPTTMPIIAGHLKLMAISTVA